MSALYESDFNSWIEEQVNLLKAKEYKHIDLENLIEEIESMGKSDRRALTSQMIRLLVHLLKFKYQPTMQEDSNSWNRTIREAKSEINLILQDSPSLHNYLEVNFRGLYLKAIRATSRETGLPLDLFETECAWKL